MPGPPRLVRLEEGLGVAKVRVPRTKSAKFLHRRLLGRLVPKVGARDASRALQAESARDGRSPGIVLGSVHRRLRRRRSLLLAEVVDVLLGHAGCVLSLALRITQSN